MKKQVSRRTFLGSVVAAGAVPGAHRAGARQGPSPQSPPAVLGGAPVRTTPFPSWPVADAREEEALTRLIRNGKWFRGEQVAAFESAYATLTGAKGCLATANGTSALITSLAAIGVGPGDEVIVPPYTFVATVNAVLLMHALPVFVDSDVETFQIDARKVELRRERVLRPLSRCLPEGAPRRRRPRIRRVLTAQQGTIPRKGVLDARVPGYLSEGAARRVACAKQPARQRPPVRRSGLADPDDAAWAAKGHGRHRGGGDQGEQSQFSYR